MHKSNTFFLGISWKHNVFQEDEYHQAHQFFFFSHALLAFLLLQMQLHFSFLNMTALTDAPTLPCRVCGCSFSLQILGFFLNKCTSIDDTHLKHSEKDLFPPLLCFSSYCIITNILVTLIYPTHILVVINDNIRLLNYPSVSLYVCFQ